VEEANGSIEHRVGWQGKWYKELAGIQSVAEGELPCFGLFSFHRQSCVLSRTTPPTSKI
jgi:hypothetical protein